jgi:hypothetical protein
MLHFLGIGAQKSGTTWLYELLGACPSIAFPSGKEVHYWDAPCGRSPEWYQRLFQVTGDHCEGEITPAYAFLPLETIQTISGYFPYLRLIYLIRNPIDRAWSSAQMALARAEMLPHEASDQWFIDHFRSSGSRARGDYESCIRNWRSAFGSEPLLIERYDSIKLEPRALLSRVLTHIGVSPEPWVTSLSQEQLARAVFSGGGESLRPTLRPILEDIYFPQIERLGQYLNQDLSDWLVPRGQ